MDSIRILSSCGLSAVLVCASGCTGNGLKNMFSRNETAGYHTLEELEGAERPQTDAAAEATAGEPTSGPRFASWIPIIGTPAGTDPSLAATDPPPTEDGVFKPEEPARWWKNPFRRHEQAQQDPFLTEESLEETSIASAMQTARPGLDSKPAASDKVSDSAKLASNTATPPAATPLTDTLKTDSGVAGDPLSDFERQFRKSTEADSDTGDDQAEPLIASSREPDASKHQATASDSSPELDDKLVELEKLLAERKSSGARQRKSAAEPGKPRFADVAEALAKAPSEDVAAVKSAAKAARNVAQSGPANVASGADQFDKLLGLTESGPQTEPGTTAGLRSSDSSALTTDATEVAVASAESLFGNAVRSVVGQSGETVKRVSGDFLNQNLSAEQLRDKGVQWADAHLTAAESAVTSKARQALESSADQMEAMINGRPSRRGTAQDSVASSGRGDSAFADELDAADGSQGRIRPASASRDAGEVPVESALDADPFFNTTAGALAAATPAGDIKAGSESANGGSGFLLSGRNWLLLLGGIIVVALLFAPDRRTATPGNPPTT